MKKKLTVSSEVAFSAEAGTSNPALGWMEFILTDALPNGNDYGIKADKFPSLAEAGLYMPLKMAEGGIASDHSKALPLGAIVSLVADDEKVSGKASVWKRERPNDYDLLMAMASADEPMHISWEILYSESTVDDNGVEWINDPSLTAATLVGSPAYAGRTPVLAVASLEEESEEEVVEEPETVEVAEEPVDEPLSEDVIKELEELRNYKKDREKTDGEAELFDNRVAELVEAGVNLSAEELNNNKEKWLSMDEAAFSFVVSMLKEKEVSASTRTVVVPDVSGDSTDKLVDIVRKGLAALKEDK